MGRTGAENLIDQRMRTAEGSLQQGPKFDLPDLDVLVANRSGLGQPLAFCDQSSQRNDCRVGCHRRRTNFMGYRALLRHWLLRVLPSLDQASSPQGTDRIRSVVDYHTRQT